ncbi:hypothetical protein O181_126762 [Austropuccinia psidii MF-1]|uniref:Uncharacterized protein n=1 Tax=Austropuccinia psidii MF-1 TaxID=1389203 RepID=A0A9Q3Q8T1_9BASI|nr:hypothetical protein [Austropuccinia psidii MF-1]
MPSTRSGAGYNPSSSSQKGNRSHYCRSQPGTEGKGSVDDFQTTKIVDIYKANHKAYKNALQYKEYQILANLWKNCINSYLTVKKFLGHPNTFKLLNGWHPLMEKKNMMLLTLEWRKNDPPPPKQVPKTAPVASSSRNSNVKKNPKSPNKGKERHKPPNLTARATGYQTPTGCHGKCVSDGQNNDGIPKEVGGQIKISEMISHIFDSIPDLYEAITDVKCHLSDKNTSTCDNLKTHNLSPSQINETLKCFEKVLRTIKTSNNDNSFGNKINEQSAIIKELTDKYSKLNIDDMIETRIKQAINNIKEDNNKALDDISKSFTEVKTHIIALKKCFDTSKEEISKLTIKLNEVISDNTKQTELWNELTYKEDDHKKNLITSIQSLQHELRNSQRCNNSKMNDIEQLLNTLPVSL